MNSNTESIEILQLREPICAVLGHVDVGKTSFLDRLRDTGLLQKEAGSITQKIGITQFSKEALDNLIGQANNSLKIPGLLFVDTPGHECFSYQRICGIGVSDLVIVIVDILKGLEKQTITCINMLKENKTPFIIVMNKVDTIYGWDKLHNNDRKNNNIKFKGVMKIQSKNVKDLFTGYVNDIICQMATEVGLNAQVYYKNKDLKGFISLVPVSSKTGAGIPDLLMMVNLLTSKFLKKNLTISNEVNNGFIVETIRDKQYGEVISGVLLNGQLKIGDTIYLDKEHHVVIEKLFVTSDTSEIKDSLSLVRVNEINASCLFVFKMNSNLELDGGVRFSTNIDDDKLINHDVNIEHVDPESEYNEHKNEVYTNHRPTNGVSLIAPTKGMLTALRTFFHSENIPIKSSIVGRVKKHDIIKAQNHSDSDHDMKTEKIYNKRFNVLVSFGAHIDQSVKKFADKNHVHIIHDDVIYRLTEKYEAYVKSINDDIKQLHPNLCKPCELQIIDKYVFRKHNPIIMGVLVSREKLTKGMVIRAEGGNNDIVLGSVVSIEKDNNAIDEAEEGDEVCIKIESNNTQFEYGKDFNAEYKLFTHFNETDEYVLNKYNEVFFDK